MLFDNLEVNAEVGNRVVGINTSTIAEGEDAKKYMNKKAQGWFKLLHWITPIGDSGFGGVLKAHKEWEKMALIKYKETTTGKLQIEPKTSGISPHHADALIITLLADITENINYNF